MKIKILFFGLLKDMVGRSDDTVNFPQGTCARDVLFYYAKKNPRFNAMILSFAISVNQEYAPQDRVLQDGDEVGILPPVSGGSTEGNIEKNTEIHGQGEVKLVRERIHAEAIVATLKQPEDGALVVFDGIVRNNTRGRRTLYLDYEAYETMALSQMVSLAADARSRFAVRGVSIVHRLGRLRIGETSVFIAVASAHRGPAFDACRWIIDTLKKTVPIWKKEYFEDGAVWADGEPFPEEFRSSGGK